MKILVAQLLFYSYPRAGDHPTMLGSSLHRCLCTLRWGKCLSGALGLASGSCFAADILQVLQLLFRAYMDTKMGWGMDLSPAAEWCLCSFSLQRRGTISSLPPGNTPGLRLILSGWVSALGAVPCGVTCAVSDPFQLDPATTGNTT